MMSPVAHACVGIFGWQTTASRKNIKTLLAFLAAANLPDVDLLFHVFFGGKGLFLHQAVTHNLFFVLLTPLFFWGILRGAKERVVLLLVSVSHLLLDLIVIDYGPPKGLRLFFPLSDRLYDFGFFPNLERGSLALVFSLHNLFTLLLEFMIFTIPLLIVYRKDFAAYLSDRDFWRTGC